VSTRILHVSDLHFGARSARLEQADEEAIAGLIERVEPTLVVATGDLTHRGRPVEHEEAARFLHGLYPRLVVVPGNHDIPYAFPARFTRTWREFERHWQTTEPVHSTPEVLVVGLNSVRPWRYQSGGIRDVQLDAAAARLGASAPGALRVVVVHHQLVNAPWRTRKRPVARRAHVLGRLVESGAELVLGGHVHQVSVCERHEFEVIDGTARGVVVATAPGFGQPRPHRRGEARGVLVHSADEQRIRVETYIWRAGDWGLTARRIFPRGPDPLAAVPDGP
jgi:3',5'-cyclic AMP phosphodiesterase CpdA